MGTLLRISLLLESIQTEATLREIESVIKSLARREAAALKKQSGWYV